MADPKTIYNWRRLNDRITTSGQPTEPQLADIHALGVRHVINLGLHAHEKALPDEAASVSRLGMTYIHIPVAFQNPTEADFVKGGGPRTWDIRCRFLSCNPARFDIGSDRRRNGWFEASAVHFINIKL